MPNSLGKGCFLSCCHGPWLLLPASHGRGAAARSRNLRLAEELKDISNPALPENPGIHLHLLSSCTHIQLLQRSDSLPWLNNLTGSSPSSSLFAFLAGGFFFSPFSKPQLVPAVSSPSDWLDSSC